MRIGCDINVNEETTRKLTELAECRMLSAFVGVALESILEDDIVLAKVNNILAKTHVKDLNSEVRHREFRRRVSEVEQKVNSCYKVAVALKASLEMDRIVGVEERADSLILGTFLAQREMEEMQIEESSKLAVQLASITKEKIEYEAGEVIESLVKKHSKIYEAIISMSTPVRGEVGVVAEPGIKVKEEVKEEGSIKSSFNKNNLNKIKRMKG